MADRLSKVAAFILGPSAKTDDDDFEAEFDDSGEELTGIVEIDSIAPKLRDSSAPRSSVTSIDQHRRGTRSFSLSEIVHIRPYSFSEAAKIGESFKQGVPIILNMSTTEQKQAQKLIDFASGMAFVTEGKLERITAKVFFLIPASVSLTEVEREQLSEMHNLGES